MKHAVTPKIVRRVITDPGSIAFPTDLHPVLKQVYLARNVTRVEQTQNTLNHLYPFEQLKGIDAAVRLLAEHIQQDRKILIVGDYDADGATSTALAMRVLRAFGAREVNYLVPNRFEYGYGLTPEIVQVACQLQPDLIMTVDNGIASVAGVAAAQQAGIKVLITDHHLPGDTLPTADAIVNPNQPGDTFASKHLAGVGVVFYILIALRAHLRELGWFTQQQRPEPNMAEYLDLVALGTVADVVKLDHNNRILVAQGLARLRAGQACAGIRALLRIAGRDERKTVSSDLGFFVGPRLNAAGRLDDMRVGIECLLSESDAEAMERAAMLDKFNRDRRQIEQTMREQAQRLLSDILAQSQTERLPVALCLYNTSFHEGVIGIIAGRIKDQTHRATIVFADSDGDTLKGSARSIPGLHIRDALDRVATRHPGLLHKFGGHAMAAGLTINKADFTLFDEAFNHVVNELIDEDILQQVLHSDGPLAVDDITLQLAETLRHAGPWGQGFPEPLFDGEFELVQRRVVAEHHLKMVVRARDKVVDAIAFHTTDANWPEQVSKVRLVYKLDVNDFNGQRSTQFIVDYVEPMD